MIKCNREGFFRRGIQLICSVLVFVVAALGVQAQDSRITDEESAFADLNIEHSSAVPTSLQKVVSLSYNQTALQEVLLNLAKEAGYQLSYSDQMVPLGRRVSINMQNVSINNALWKVLDGTGLQFALSPNKHLVLMKGAGLAEQTMAEPISGTVTDAQTDETLPGVNILVKGTSTGASTDAEGNFELTVPSLQDTLVVSFVGYQTQEVPVNGRTEIDISLEPQAITGEEMVVVGYGAQEKMNVTGSVTEIETEEIENISTQRLSESLMGRSPGVFIRNSQGMPGNDDIEMSIRGFGDPLIIVDGTPVSESYFQQLESTDIESFNVLKDASAAAVYGARAGNGVILVETKRGIISEPQFKVRSRYGQQFFTYIPDYVTSAGYAEMENVGLMNAGQPPRWSDEEIQKFKDGSDPDYPNTDWWEETLKPSAPTHEHGISVRGGSEKVRYYTSLNYDVQQGFLRSNDLNHKTFSLRSNLDISLTEKLDIGLDLSLVNQDFLGPGASFQNNISARIARGRPFHPNLWHQGPDPNMLSAVGSGSTMNPYHLSFIENTGFEEWNRLFGFAKLSLEYELPYGFKARALFDMNRTYREEKHRNLEMPTYDYDEEEGEYIFRRAFNDFDDLTHTNGTTKSFNQQYFLTWDKTFRDHELSSMVVFERLVDNYSFLSAYRRDFNFDLPYLFAGSEQNQNTDGYKTEGGRKSYIGRINYNYQEKYLLEISGRYDASPNFPPDTRWGFFPSVSVGWVLTEEDFIQIPSFINDLKLRISHGKTGYDRAGDFQYLTTYIPQSEYIYGGDEVLPGLRNAGLANSNITWEKMVTSNIGLDFNMWDGSLEGTIELFYRSRSDVLGTQYGSVPNIVGANLPQVNLEEYDNRGGEIMLRYRDNIGGINFSLGGNVSYNREKSVYVDQPEFVNMEAYRTGNEVGEWTDHHWTYPTDGLFRSQEEIDNWADIDGQGNASIRPGDIKYVDHNEDGRISSEDRIIAGRGGTDLPRLMYGIDFSVFWKGFDIEMLWQGGGLYNLPLYNNADLTHPFWASNQPTMFMYNNSYTPENPWKNTLTDDAVWPRYGTDSYNRNHTNFRGGAGNIQFWLASGSYLRLKNIQLGYTIPAGTIERWGLNSLKLYVSSYNLVTFAQYNFVDPEQQTNYDLEHPPTGNVNLGVQIEF